MKAELTSGSGQVGEGLAQMWAGGEGLQGKGLGGLLALCPLAFEYVYVCEYE